MVWLLLKDDIHAKELLSFFQLIGAQTSRTVFQVGGLRGGYYFDPFFWLNPHNMLGNGQI